MIPTNLRLAVVTLGRNEMLEQLIHVKMSAHSHVDCTENKRRRLLEDPVAGSETVNE